MGVFVLEIQNDSLTAYHYSQQDYENGVADQKFHTICAAAAVSNVARHVVMMINDEGGVLKQEIFNHSSNESSNE